MIIAVVPAAGRSARMGRSKLILPLGRLRVIEHVLRALEAAPVDHTLLVMSAEDTELRGVVKPYHVQLVELAEPTVDMRASLARGLAHAEALWSQPPPDAFLV